MRDDGPVFLNGGKISGRDICKNCKGRKSREPDSGFGFGRNGRAHSPDQKFGNLPFGRRSENHCHTGEQEHDSKIRKQRRRDSHHTGRAGFHRVFQQHPVVIRKHLLGSVVLRQILGLFILRSVVRTLEIRQLVLQSMET